MACCVRVGGSLPLEVLKLDPSDQESVKKIKSIVSEWKDLMFTRLTPARLVKDASEENMRIFLEDRKVCQDYSDVLGYIKGAVQQSKECVILCAQKEDRIQGLCVGSIKPSSRELYINGLVTAPWNIRMQSPCDETLAELFQKGVGTRLMLESFEFAAKEHLFKVTATPLASSWDFYEKLGMVFDREKMVFIQEIPEDMDLEGSLEEKRAHTK